MSPRKREVHVNPRRPFALLQHELLLADPEAGGHGVVIDIRDEVELSRAMVAPQSVCGAFNRQSDAMILVAVTCTIRPPETSPPVSSGSSV